ncbi:helix-turn-helix transcriptional regulator [Chryseobacterium sp. KACC 21268]|nr:helix-turn-helix transcriptional regulator [Chryseobacterium sp. KACC 21268]
MKLYSIILIVLCFQISKSQSINITELTKKIYNYNNNLQYKKSQDTLINLLENDDLPASEQIEINILLSLTYKRLQDYTSVIYYLTNAKKIALEQNSIRANAKIDAQFAFAYFDIQNYNKADELMQEISTNNYRFLDNDDTSKILMQQGFVKFLKRQYKAAEDFYYKASSLMQKSNHCDLPIVYGKQIQLYFTENNSKKTDYYYKLGVEKARQCHILKYEIYLAEVMMNLYKEKKDVEKTFIFTRKFDSLNRKYKPVENLQQLHIEREIKAKNFEEKDKRFRWQIIIFYTLVVIILITIAFFLVRYALNLKSRNKEHMYNIEEMKQLLIEYEMDKKSSISRKLLLNVKQLSIFEMIKQGKSNKEIANNLHVSENTIKYHIKIIYETLNIKKRSQLKDIH